MSQLVSERVRHDFPLLQSERPLVYFDNACATLKPEPVLQAMDEYNREYPTCGGRSINRLGERVTRAVANARIAVARFLNAAQPEEILFVRNTTEGINLLARGLDLQPGDVVLTTDKEHNSNLVPWQLLAQQRGVVHTVVRTHADGTFDMAAYQAALASGKVRLVAMGQVSNLDGVAIPAEHVIEAAHAAGALVLLDAAQAAPHHHLDVQALDVDMLVFSGHKLCGPSGTGVVYVRHQLLEQLQPFIVGGSTVSATTYDGFTLLPARERFEGGTQDYAGIIGLGAAIAYVTDVGLANISAHEHALNRYATERMSQLTGVQIIGPDAAQRSGILSFTIDGVDIHQIALALDNGSDVLVRSGQHCVHSWFTDRGLYGSVRLSFYFYNTTHEIDQCINGLEQIIAVYT